MSDYWLERRWTAMGSDAHLQLGDAHDDLADWAMAEVERLEQCWSRFRPDSELCHLNANLHRWVPVSAPLFDALELARQLHARSEGVFDPTVHDALVAAGYDRSFGMVDLLDPRPASLARPAGGFVHVLLDRERRAVRTPYRLDLGGLGKGLAADRVAEGLVDRGARSALVALGGDIRVAGLAPEGGWPIPVEDPFDAARVMWRHPLEAGALVTSTRLLRRWQRAEVEYHHLIDPVTGAPARTPIVAVIAAGPEAATAEVMAKTVLVRGTLHAFAWPAGSQVWICTEDGLVRQPVGIGA